MLKREAKADAEKLNDEGKKLLKIIGAKPGLSEWEVAERIGVLKYGALPKLLGDLEERGLIKNGVVRVVLTGRGRAALEVIG